MIAGATRASHRHHQRGRFVAPDAELDQDVGLHERLVCLENVDVLAASQIGGGGKALDECQPHGPMEQTVIAASVSAGKLPTTYTEARGLVSGALDTGRGLTRNEIRSLITTSSHFESVIGSQRRCIHSTSHNLAKASRFIAAFAHHQSRCYGSNVFASFEVRLTSGEKSNASPALTHWSGLRLNATASDADAKPTSAQQRSFGMRRAYSPLTDPAPTGSGLAQQKNERPRSSPSDAPASSARPRSSASSSTAGTLPRRPASYSRVATSLTVNTVKSSGWVDFCTEQDDPSVPRSPLGVGLREAYSGGISPTRETSTAEDVGELSQGEDDGDGDLLNDTGVFRSPEGWGTKEAYTGVRITPITTKRDSTAQSSESLRTSKGVGLREVWTGRTPSY
ncbi:hypothetical protein M427DRAFT_251204 [Gonapodya prolifera JEL478]|uniref:Uncharacterized protein n=1 Tax=Gonapodya prolifera (strain JEL478) TaxID=1344416 RepID=A0A138ZX78_GONPJ|nr:hypothetical protein M427DRAFT_251204 [Gonapodya prolifera JEL478]|eukprot:KXS09106.1 hypothetical protein M427DRAFT_251204 [Gonapodya prolifera JEL478]